MTSHHQFRTKLNNMKENVHIFLFVILGWVLNNLYNQPTSKTFVTGMPALIGYLIKHFLFTLQPQIKKIEI